jgi:CRP-like cAMP-binding protein
MFAIVSGTADVSQHGTPIRTLAAGDVFGEIAVLSGGRRTATVTATSRMKLFAILNRDIWRLEREPRDRSCAEADQRPVPRGVTLSRPADGGAH